MQIYSIEGNIGSGKSSILNRLATKYNVIQEDVDNWKNEGWLELFYNNINRYAGTFQLRTQLSHIENKSKFIENQINIIERSPISNKYIFGKMLMEDGFLHEKEYNLISKVNSLVGWSPDQLIVLLCEPEICQIRIKHRNRPGESINIEYLQALHKKHLELKSVLEIPVHYVDTTKKTIDEVENEVLTIIKK